MWNQRQSTAMSERKGKFKYASLVEYKLLVGNNAMREVFLSGE